MSPPNEAGASTRRQFLGWVGAAVAFGGDRFENSRVWPSGRRPAPTGLPQPAAASVVPQTAAEKWPLLAIQYFDPYQGSNFLTLQQVARYFDYVWVSPYAPAQKQAHPPTYENAAQLKGLNPRLKISGYGFPAFFTYVLGDDGMFPEILRHEEWFLHNPERSLTPGDRVALDSGGGQIFYMLDMANVAYQAYRTNAFIRQMLAHGAPRAAFDGFEADTPYASFRGLGFTHGPTSNQRSTQQSRCKAFAQAMRTAMTAAGFSFLYYNTTVFSPDDPANQEAGGTGDAALLAVIDGTREECFADGGWSGGTMPYAWDYQRGNFQRNVNSQPTKAFIAAAVGTLSERPHNQERRFILGSYLLFANGLNSYLQFGYSGVASVADLDYLTTIDVGVPNVNDGHNGQVWKDTNGNWRRTLTKKTVVVNPTGNTQGGIAPLDAVIG